MNKVYLIGNLVRDPETRMTGNGIEVCNFTIAVNRRRKQQDGAPEADFLTIVAWRQLAGLCKQYLSKGKKVAVSGSIQTRSYEAKDGSKRTAFDIIADEVEFLSKADGAEAAYIRQERDAIQHEPGAYVEAVSKDAQTDGFTQTDTDELPF